ncbi:putative metal-binding enzyme [Wigglesworthia glossinidia endosymbiont of Glossina morsitans morsitans (Yale colony)]|uniref:Putative metal-binding enzyme n=1 Tax=Wigglesworthia glossinidia endosymbiont of Glossina morsitans morsitans (Yale colony) TaxID=1142511 RepID=H6Q5I8_WIGGL|nr:MBL fold metallo-hydrolase [Wigglesworthia glossinidia]AFA41471.1 putative metal-binding enzyme [Wigglesworthia glossinidia endosymbiont of Glossina morsitans morsitans (Yale colony)]
MLNFKSQVVTNFHENSYCIWSYNNTKAILVDPGGEPKKLLKFIKNLKISITKILLTHGHIDHVGAAVFFSKLYRIPIIGPHIHDNFLLNNLPNQSKIFNIYPKISAFVPHRWLSDGDEIVVGSSVLKVIYCPGHSPGHIALWNIEKKILISGDIIFKYSIGRTDLLGGNTKQMKNSLIKKIFPLFNKSDRVKILPGHGETFFMDQEYIDFIHKTFL